MSVTLDEALSLANRGFSVIPLRQDDKKPTIEWTELQTRCATEDEIRRMFVRDNLNLGIVTGPVSGIVVLDVDDTQLLKSYGSIPRTPTVKTGKGLHYYFKHPSYSIGNRVIKRGENRLGEFQALGRYVVAPPSIHETGTRYQWVIGLDEAPLAEMPEWLKNEVEREERVSTPIDLDHDVPTTAYAQKWIDEDVADLAQAKWGGRNNLLNEVACKGFSLVAGGEISRRAVVAHLWEAARRNGLAYDKSSGGMQGVGATIRSAEKTGMRNPRAPKDDSEFSTSESSPGRKLNLVRLSDAKIEQVDWLWPGVLARKKLALIAGHGGVGKSTIVCDIAARITTGGYWPASNVRAEIGDVVILQLEDGVADTLKPRLLAAGGDSTRVHVISTTEGKKGETRPFNFKDDMQLLADTVRELRDVRLIVIDPIMGYMGSLNPDKAAEVRKLTTPLSILAEETGACVLMIGHSNKSEEKKAINSVQGSGAFVQAVRTAFSVYKDSGDEDRRYMAPIKTNITKDDVTRAYRIESRKVMEHGLTVETSSIVWEEKTIKATAEDVQKRTEDSGWKRTQAKDFILGILSAGPKSTKQITSEATSRGISTATLYRAKDDLGVLKDYRDGTDHWKLPELV